MCLGAELLKAVGRKYRADSARPDLAPESPPLRPTLAGVEEATKGESRVNERTGSG